MKLLAFSLALCLTTFSATAPAVGGNAVRRIPESVALGQNGASLPAIAVWEGAGTNINFIPTRETIKKVWIDDPSQITLDFDGVLCDRTSDRRSDCQSSGASIIHLRRIEPLSFPGLPSTKETLLSVITEGAGGRKLYQFRLVLGQGTPQYHAIEIVPDADPVPSQNWDAVERGLYVAASQRLIQVGSPLWQRVQNFLVRVRHREPVALAAQRSGISLQLVERLQQLGRGASTRPQTPANLQPIVVPADRNLLQVYNR